MYADALGPYATSQVRPVCRFAGGTIPSPTFLSLSFFKTTHNVYIRRNMMPSQAVQLTVDLPDNYRRLGINRVQTFSSPLAPFSSGT